MSDVGYRIDIISDVGAHLCSPDGQRDAESNALGVGTFPFSRHSPSVTEFYMFFDSVDVYIL
jgi:hypothetical protein